MPGWEEGEWRDETPQCWGKLQSEMRSGAGSILCDAASLKIQSRFSVAANALLIAVIPSRFG